jgi:carboxyl-terminal processing protease
MRSSPRPPTWLALALLASLQAQIPPQERERHLASFDFVWTTIRDRHYDPTLGGLDWKAIREELRPRVESAKSTGDVRSALREMIGRLKLSHFQIIPRELLREMARPPQENRMAGETGIQVRVLEGAAIVTAVRAGSTAEEAGVKPGWEIRRIGKEDLRPVIEKVGREFAGRSRRDLVLADVAQGRLEGAVGSRVEVEFVDGAGAARTLGIPLAEPRGSRLRVGLVEGVSTWIDAQRIEKVGYIAFNLFINAVYLMPAFQKALEDFRDTDGLIIDLRGNTGGTLDVALGMAGWLVAERGHNLGTLILREARLKAVVKPRQWTYPGRVAVLVDGGTVCGGEVFAAGLQELGRARVFGTCTAGIVQGGMIEELPNGDGFMFAAGDYESAQGKRLEGIGMVPDVDVAHGREALLAGRDLPLEAALDWIKQEGRKTK